LKNEFDFVKPCIYCVVNLKEDGFNVIKWRGTNIVYLFLNKNPKNMNTKFYNLIIILLLINSLNFAQEASKIKPVKIVWVADGDTIDIDQAQRGINMPNNIEIAVVFDSRTIGKLDGQKLEFKWFRKGATRNYLTNSFYQEFNSAIKGPKAYTLSTGRGELKKGWWKVQIEAYADRNLLSYRNKQEFWINLK